MVRTTKQKYYPNGQYLQWLGIVLIVVSIVTILLRFFTFDYFSTCSNSPYTKVSNPDKLGTAFLSSWTRDVISFGIPRLLLLTIAYRIYVSSSRKFNVVVSIIALWSSYFGTLFILEHIKLQSSDDECNSHGNAISGHGYYVTWMIINLTYLLIVLEREITLAAKRPNVLEEFLLSTRPIGIASTMVQVVFTYYYGYHSLQQIFLGAIFGMGHCIFMCFLSEYVFLYPGMRIKTS